MSYLNDAVEKDDYDQNEIDNHVKELYKTYSFDNYSQELVFKSGIKNRVMISHHSSI